MRHFLGFTLLVLAAAVGLLIALMPRAQFETATDVYDVVTRGGFSLYDDGRHNIPRTSFFVADRTLTRDDVAQLVCRYECGLTPQWEGIVWVCQIHSNGHELVPSSIGGNTRIWGNVLLAGDAKLMDRLEQSFRGEIGN